MSDRSYPLTFPMPKSETEMKAIELRIANIKFIIVDQRTGKQTCSGTWSEKSAHAQIAYFKERQIKGGRPDISKEDVDNLIVREMGL